MKKLVAIIVGGTGQYGIFTGKLLLSKNYKVIITTRSIRKKLNILKPNKNLILQKLNIYNKKQIRKLILKFKPNLILYYAGQSSPDKSFKLQKETYKSNFVGCKNFLDVINKQKINCKFLNATSCEIFGKINGKIKISSIKRPISPYGLSKLKSYEITKNYMVSNSLKVTNFDKRIEIDDNKLTISVIYQGNKKSTYTLIKDKGGRIKKTKKKSKKKKSKEKKSKKKKSS